MTDTPDKATLLAIAEAAQHTAGKCSDRSYEVFCIDPEAAGGWDIQEAGWLAFADALRAKAGGE